MSDINDLRRQRAEAADKLVALNERAMNEKRVFTDQEQAEFDQLDKLVADLDRQIAAAERANAVKAFTAKPAKEATGSVGANDPPRVEVVADDERIPGIHFAQMTRALVVARGNMSAAAQFAEQTFGGRHPVTEAIGAALGSNEFSGGGALVPERFTAEVVPLLRPMTTIRRNARVIPLVGGTDTMPTVENGTSAYYVGENTDITMSEPQFGQIKFTEREIAALVPMSNKLLRHAGVAVDMVIRDDLIQGFAQTEDLYFLRGNGTGAGPKGLRYLAPSASVIAANGTINVANIDTDARKLELCLMNANLPMRNRRWLMAPRTFTYLRDLRDSNGNLVYPGLSLANPTWKGYAVEMTTQIPINLGSGGDESELYLVEFGNAIVADSYNIRIDASESASYKSGSNLISAYSQNQTVIRALAGHDFALNRAQAVAVLTTVKWGA
ncbi:MAG TPA: phage major capsid protein [Noviherbaspirillum sp.]|nr:phage major capsid protein [Noviherbaspirillum sp.]